MRRTLNDSRKHINIQQMFLPSFAGGPISGENLPAHGVVLTTETLLVQAEETVLAPCQRRGISGVPLDLTQSRRPANPPAQVPRRILLKYSMTDWRILPASIIPHPISHKSLTFMPRFPGHT